MISIEPWGWFILNFCCYLNALNLHTATRKQSTCRHTMGHSSAVLHSPVCTHVLHWQCFPWFWRSVCTLLWSPQHFLQATLTFLFKSKVLFYYDYYYGFFFFLFHLVGFVLLTFLVLQLQNYINFKWFISWKFIF